MQLLRKTDIRGAANAAKTGAANAANAAETGATCSANAAETGTACAANAAETGTACAANATETGAAKTGTVIAANAAHASAVSAAKHTRNGSINSKNGGIQCCRDIHRTVCVLRLRRDRARLLRQPDRRGGKPYPRHRNSLVGQLQAVFRFLEIRF